MNKQQYATKWKQCLTVSLWVSVLTLAVVQPSQSSSHEHGAAHKKESGRGTAEGKKPGTYGADVKNASPATTETVE